jgi:hypothetical protein
VFVSKSRNVSRRAVSPISRRDALCALASTVTLGTSASAQARGSKTLFLVRRSANRNTVYFDLPTPVTDPAQPLNIYWRLFQTDGRVEALNWLERRLAYGYEVTQRPSRDVLQLTFAACSDRPIEVHLGAQPQAVLKIGGVRSVLSEIFVTAEETGIIPRIKHIDLLGVTLDTKQRRVERIPV